MKSFKDLSKVKNIGVVLLAILLFPITLLVLSCRLLVKGVKAKKVGKIVGGAVLSVLSLFFAIAIYTPTENVVKLISIKSLVSLSEFQ